MSNLVLEISTTNSPGTGTNHTATPTVLGCYGDRIRIEFHNIVFANIWGGLSTSAAYDNIFATNEFIIIYMTIAPGSNVELPALHHEYIFAVGVNTYYYGAHYYTVRKAAYLPTQSLSSTFAISTISNNRDGVTEFMMDIGTLAVGVGSSTTNYLLLAEIIGGTSWTSTNDPFSSYVNTAITEEYIECKCLSAIGTISITTTSPYVDASCQRRLPVSGGFNAYAILIDFNANAGESVRCYFPEFKIFSGMVFSVELKTVYGNSYPPDLTGGNTYGAVYRKTSNQLNFAGSSPTMPASAMSSLSETSFYPSAVTVGTTFGSTYTVTGTWGAAQNTPYIYINYRKAGPVPATSFCSDSNIFLECRVFTKYLNLIVAKLKSTSTTSFSMSRGSSDIFYPSSQFSDSSLYNAIVYVGTTQWLYASSISRSQANLAPISTNTFLVYSDLYGSSRATFTNIITIAMGVNGKTLFRYLDTGSKIDITFSGITTQKLSCQVWVQNEPSVELTCIVAAGIITIYSERTDYTTNNLIFVEFGATNPQTTSITFTMKMYSYYNSPSRYSLVISRTATYTIDNSWSSSTRIAK